MKKENPDKIISFRTDTEHQKKLKDIVYRDELNHKEWIEDSITTSEAQSILSNTVNESWVRIPASEYSKLLLSQWKEHACFICDRIQEHVKVKKEDLTFDNLFFETMIFHNMNKVKMVRFEDGDLETIHVKHNFGDGYANFETELICQMVIRSKDYELVSKVKDGDKLTVKIKKN